MDHNVSPLISVLRAVRIMCSRYSAISFRYGLKSTQSTQLVLYEIGVSCESKYCSPRQRASTRAARDVKFRARHTIINRLTCLRFSPRNPSFPAVLLQEIPDVHFLHVIGVDRSFFGNREIFLTWCLITASHLEYKGRAWPYFNPSQN